MLQWCFTAKNKKKTWINVNIIGIGMKYLVKIVHNFLTYVWLSKFGNFSEKKEFSNLQNFREKVWKKVQKFKFGKKLRY